MPTNFTACAAANVPLSNELIELYGYNDSLSFSLIDRNRSTQVTLEGCRKLCGTGIHYYSWGKQSGTLTTWIFPVLGILLQAPFTSNAFWATVFALARWIGNPIASLTYVLWNITVTGTCALLVDLSVSAETMPTDPAHEDTAFFSVRDSFYLLCVMNQYTIRSEARRSESAKSLLKVVLFSDDLEVLDSNTGTRTDIDDRRHRLADNIRQARRRGAVPVFLSDLWFLFSLSISVQSAFGLLGLNSEAHDLALGCLFSWLPVLILGSVIDRNPTDPEKIKQKFNKLIVDVRRSLSDAAIREDYLRNNIAESRRDSMRDCLQSIDLSHQELDDFFENFAGQGRLRWHYGCANSILQDIKEGVTRIGRNWMTKENAVRTSIMLKHSNDRLDRLNYREMQQVFCAALIVFGTICGAFILSFFTPTVGLGCRSGGYLIYFVSAVALILAESMIWWLIDERQKTLRAWFVRLWCSTSERLELEATSERILQQLRTHGPTQKVVNVSKAAVQPLKDVVPGWLKESWRDSSAAAKVECATFRLAEGTNTVWLIYIVCAQTFGSYNKCVCRTSAWGLSNPYMDFIQSSTTNNPYVRFYWIGGTVLSVSTMGIALSYMVVQWCLQSHLSTLDLHRAAKGLGRVRRFRRLTTFAGTQPSSRSRDLQPDEPAPGWSAASYFRTPSQGSLETPFAQPGPAYHSGSRYLESSPARSSGSTPSRNRSVSPLPQM